MAETTRPSIPTERLSVEVRQRLLEEDAAIIGRPFDMGNNPRAIQAHARHMALLMRDTSQPDGASRAAAFAEQMISTILTNDVKGPVACGKGCSWCCTTFVSTSIPEIFNLARAVRQSPSVHARSLTAAAKAKGIPQKLRERQRIVCPVLENNACSLYASRPLICRSLLSTSLETCLTILVENRPAEMTHADKTPLIRMATIIIMKAAIRLAGLSPSFHELTQGLEVALASEDAEERWLRGEPLFAHVPMDEAEATTDSPLEGLVTTLVNVVRPTL